MGTVKKSKVKASSKGKPHGSRGGDVRKEVLVEIAKSGMSVNQIAKKMHLPVSQIKGIVRDFATAIDPRFGEIAIANSQMWTSSKMPIFNPSEIVTRKGMRIFDQMRNDDQIKAAIWFKKLSCVSSGWEVNSPEGMDETYEPSVYLKQEFAALDEPIEHIISTGILTALDYGYSVSEIVFRKIEYGDFMGMIGFKDIKTKRPHDIKFKVDDYGNLLDDGVVQMTNKGGEVSLPKAKFIIFAYQKEFGNPYGRSDMEAAYSKWWIKENAYRWLAILLERFGVPPIFAMYDPNSMSPDQVASLRKAIERIQASTAGALPRASQESLELWAPELAGQTGRVFIPALEMLNRDISRSLLMPGLMGLTPDTGVGSYARARVEFDVFVLMIEHLRNLIAGAINNQLVKPIVMYNFEIEPHEVPIFKFLPLTDDLRLEMFKTWGTMVQQGVVKTNQEDEDHIRKSFGFPSRGSDVEEDEDPTEPPNVDPEGNDDTGSDDEFVDRFAEKRTLYVNRRLKNTDEFIVWAKSQGFQSVIVPEDIHTTIAFSRTPVDWSLMGDDEPAELKIPASGDRTVEKLGDKGAAVLKFNSFELSARWQEIIDNGGSWDHDSYQPHVTLTYDSGDVKLEDVEPYDGELIFGPEIFEEVDDGWSEKVAEAKEKSGSLYYREKTKFEKEVDFKQIERDLNGLEKKAIDAIVPEMVKIRDRFLKFVETKFERDTRFVKKLGQLRGIGGVYKQIYTFLEDSYNAGSRNMAIEIGVSRKAEIKSQAQAPNFKPKDAQKYLKTKAFWITGIIDSKLQEKARGILLRAISSGEPLPTTMQKLRDTFEPYVGDPNLIRGDDVVSASRLETIIRTNATDAFNQGRIVEARRAGEFLVGFQYSAILDSVTTEVCAHLDGRIFKPDDPALDELRPPRHFNCRSTLVAVTIDEEVKESDYISPSEIGKAVELSGVDFGGSGRYSVEGEDITDFYDPRQPRNKLGRWGSGGRGGVSGGAEVAEGALSDRLDDIDFNKMELGEKIDLLKDRIAEAGKGSSKALSARKKLLSAQSKMKDLEDEEKQILSQIKDVKKAGSHSKVRGVLSVAGVNDDELGDAIKGALADMHPGSKLGKFSDLQLLAVSTFKGGTFKGDTYKQINSSLKKGKVPSDVSAFRGTLDAALDKMDKVKKNVYRGVSVDSNTANSILKAYSPGRVVEEKGFLSTSRSKSVADRFAGNGDVAVIYKIKSKSGADLSSVFKRDAEREKEVLFKSGSKFKVLSAQDFVDNKSGKRTLNVSMSEV